MHVAHCLFSIGNDIDDSQVIRQSIMTSSNLPAAKKSRESKQDKLQEGNHSSSMLPFDNDVSPLSKPYIHFILTKSHVNPIYVMITYEKDITFETISKSTFSNGSNIMVLITILCRGKSWETTLCVNSKMKKLDKRWKLFVDDNGLKAGDALFWELLETSNEKVNFKVHIIKGDFPAELAAKIDGNTSNAPIRIE
ncbi:hypothetical protein M9H77_34017 [Catharanthus roseus]|uniref:Uncharacterized protein n=1 Tax=Catharanthus roseus TaxID=4058 RepID=A0ACB9ZM57_CATRO|nr:hypothetical protein M9H77_34017 [Catharanthus roseus]